MFEAFAADFLGAIDGVDHPAILFKGISVSHGSSELFAKVTLILKMFHVLKQVGVYFCKIKLEMMTIVFIVDDDNGSIPLFER